MAKTQAKNAIRNIFKRIENALEDAVKPNQVRPTARFTIDLIVKRTRLGYGVNRPFGTKTKLKKLSKPYIGFRNRYRQLDSSTSPSKSNQTLTGQMLRSMKILSESDGEILIGPSGNRTKIHRKEKSRTNAEIADYQAEQGRVWNKVSQLEYLQILRHYRRTFGDLLKKKRLIR